MFRRYVLFLTVIYVIIMIGTSCSNSQQTRPPGSTSVGGATIKTALEINGDFETIESQTNFEPNQEFYFYFHNNLSFGSDQISVQLIDNNDEKILAETDYEVDPDNSQLYDRIWFGSRGMYTIVVKVDGEVRATREIIIEQ